MSAEQKKFLWISLSVCLFVLALAATGLFLFVPKKGGAAAPATIGNVAAPKAADPQDFLVSPPPAPSFEQPRSAAGDVVVVYGEKPESLDGSAGTALPAGQAAPAPALPAVPAPAAPAPAPKSASKSVPQAAPKAPAAVAKAQPQKKQRVDEYWIQAAAFSSRGRADELKDSLAAQGIASFISVKDIDGKSWYRVRIGPYAGMPEAEGWLARLKALPGCSEAYISKTVVERNG
ncbi:MAG TPA: SPOR domain-containing protein [Spirochaetales bacterium]|nr:SPOR domain-containing protein [Spirochaetales bacterium]HRY55587.1 SPOR domain-containing protein [Spirochaetia bacterium]HRZ63454.1 SPOR domain-containing protein [Spirochaetia bacterium]